MTPEDGDRLPPPPPDLVEDLRRIAAREAAPDSVREAARSYLQSLSAAAADSGPLRAEARVTVTASGGPSERTRDR
jgi:hypothetical protein